MKKAISLILSFLVTLFLCACSVQELLPQTNNTTITPESSETVAIQKNNPLVGVWVSKSDPDPAFAEIERPTTFFIFNDNYTLYGLQATGNGRLSIFLMQGTYEIISDNQILIKGIDEFEEYCENTSTFSFINGKLVIDNDMSLEPLNTGINTPTPLVGIWKTLDGSTFSFRLGNTGYFCESIEFFRDGSYSIDSGKHNGFYSVIHDGKALQVFSSNRVYEHIMEIKDLGCGLMIFDGTILQHS